MFFLSGILVKCHLRLEWGQALSFTHAAYSINQLV